MAKPQAAAPADPTLVDPALVDPTAAVDVNALAQVMVAPSGDALAMAVAGGKQVSAGISTDLTEAKGVVEANGTTIVRW